MGIDVRKLVASILICQIVGNLGSVFTFSSITTWYSLLKHPSFAPPNWVFAPVWLTLYTLMGISLYLVWKSKGKRNAKNPALALFGIQLFLNFLWSLLFFGLHSVLLGFAGIVVLWIAIVVTVTEFSRISRTAAWLLIPYLAWVSFAALLNFSFLILN